MDTHQSGVNHVKLIRDHKSSWTYNNVKRRQF